MDANAPQRSKNTAKVKHRQRFKNSKVGNTLQEAPILRGSPVLKAKLKDKDHWGKQWNKGNEILKSKIEQRKDIAQHDLLWGSIRIHYVYKLRTFLWRLILQASWGTLESKVCASAFCSGSAQGTATVQEQPSEAPQVSITLTLSQRTWEKESCTYAWNSSHHHSSHTNLDLLYKLIFPRKFTDKPTDK